MLQELMQAAELDMRLVDSMTFEQVAPDTTPELYQGHTGWIRTPTRWSISAGSR